MKKIFNHDEADFLTKLHGRKYFFALAKELLEHNKEFSVFSIDLNRFKLINDVHGHDIGDIVLTEVGKRLKTLENEELLFARFGGDEFVALYQTTDVDRINQLGDRIHQILADNVVIHQSEFTISASIGVARYPNDAEKIAELLKIADVAMYQSKKSELNQKYLITNEISDKLHKRNRIEQLLQDIDVNRDLFLEYQPIFDFKANQLVALEGLVRWNHPKEGVICPSDFIPIAEELDMIKKITEWTFITGLHQIKEWNENYNQNLKLSLNISNQCIHNKIFFVNLSFMLEEFKVKPEWIAIELKEFSLSISPNYMKKILLSISNLGVDIYLDDFGTSPIMLSSLKEFKINTIKIDNKYINGMNKEENFSFIQAAIVLAHALDIKVVAEGVETEDEYIKLKASACDKFQGFYKSHPLSKEAFEQKYLRK